MKNKGLRAMSALLALVMLLLCLPFSLVALAAGEEAPSAPEELKTLKAYRHASVQTKDNTVGLTVNVHTYYDKEKTYTVSKQGVEGTPVIFYVMNTTTKRLGKKTDAELVSSFLTRGYFVLVLDYLKSSDAVSPALDLSIQDIRQQVIGGQNFTGTKTYTAGAYTNGKLKGADPEMAIAYVLPAGYDIAYRIPYFSYDLYGAAGTFEKIVEVWNNDFKSVHRGKLVKWVNEAGNRKATEAIQKTSADDKSGITDYAVWFKDANGSDPISEAELATRSAEEQKAYKYTYIGNTKVTNVTDCVKPDGTFIDLNLYMDVFYPSGETEKVPVMVCMASTYTRAEMLTINTRPQMTGFLFSGYAGVVSDYGLVPMCRNDHYGYFCGNSRLNAVSGDNYTYSLSMYNGIESDSAMLRTIRKMAVDGIEVDGFDGILKFNFLPDKIGIYGNSKSGYCIRFANPHPEDLENGRHFEGHLGESRLEAKNDKSYGYNDPYIGEDGKTTNEKIRLPEEQPYLTYNNGTVISSQANLVYAQCGAGQQAIVKGSAPIFGTGTQKPGGDGSSYWSFYSQVMVRARNADVPFFGLVSPDVGHDFGYGEDQSYGIDTYYAFHRYANYHLQNSNAECMVIDVDTVNDIGADNQKAIDNIYEIGKDSSIKLAFTGPVGGEEIAKVQIVDAVTGEGVFGIWHGSYGDQQWKFLPTDIKDGTYYRVIVPDTILAKNGKPLKEAKSLTFRTESGVTVPASAASGADTVTDTDASFVTFDPDTIRTAHRIDLRFTVENDASNTVVISGASLAAGETYESVTAWETLGEVVLTGAGTYSFDVTNFVRACAGTPAFRLQAKYAAGTNELHREEMNEVQTNGFPYGCYFTPTAKVSLSDEVKSADGSDNSSLKLEYIVRNSNYIDLDNNLCGNSVPNIFWLGNAGYWASKNNKFGESDYGRTFRLSFRLYDKTSRLVSISVGEEVAAKGGVTVTDPQNYTFSFYTKAGEWTPVTLEFRIDDPADWEVLNKQSILFSIENKSIAVLDANTAVDAKGMAKDDASRSSFYAGSAGLNDSYQKFVNAAKAEAEGKVTVNADHTDALYFDDFVYEEIRTAVTLAASPTLAVKPMEEKDSLPVKATYVSSSDPDLSGEGDTLYVGGGNLGYDGQSVKSYVQLSLGGYSGKTAALLFRASGRASTIAVYGVADVASGESWTTAGITAASAPANDRYSSGVELSAVWGGAPLATFTVNGEGQEFALDLTDFASEMYLAGATAVTLIFVSESAESLTEIQTLDFTENYKPIASAYDGGVLSYKQKSEGDGVLEIYPEATKNADCSIQFGCADAGNFLPLFTKDFVGRTYRITFRVKANATGTFTAAMMSPKSRQTTILDPSDNTTDEADEKNYFWKPYLPQEYTIEAANEWQTFTYEFTVDPLMVEKYVSHYGEFHAAINCFALRTFTLNPNRNDSAADIVAKAKALTDPAVVLSVDSIKAEEIIGGATIDLIDKVQGTPVGNGGFLQPASQGVSGTFVKDWSSKGYITLNPSLVTNPNANQNVQVRGWINNSGICNLFTAENVNKTFHLTFKANASEAGRLDMTLTAGSGNDYRWNYSGAEKILHLVQGERTYSYDLTVTEAMVALHNTLGDNFSLSPAFKFYEGFRGTDGAYKNADITLSDFRVYEVQESAYATDGTVLADFESDGITNSARYFEYRYKKDENGNAKLYTRDSFERVKEAENAHSGSYAFKFHAMAPNALPYFTNLLPTSYTEEERGNTYTVSFYLKATKTGRFKLALTSESGGNYIALGKLDQPGIFTVTEAGVWQKYTYTYTVGDAQLQADKPAVYLAIHPFEMNQSNEFTTGEDNKRYFVSEDPVDLYFDDFLVRRTTPSVPLTETNLTIVEKTALSEAGTSDELTVTAAPSVGNVNIRRTYLTFAPYDGAELYEATLCLNLTKAAGQTVKVYALYGAMPDVLTFATAPAITGTPVATFTAAVGEMRIDVTSAILTAGGKAVTFVLVVDEGGEDVGIECGTDTPHLIYGAKKTSDVDPATFKVKANITLSSDFLYNAYIPAFDEVKEITLDGTTLPLYNLEKVTIGKQEFYRVTKSLAARRGTDSMTVKVLLDIGEMRGTKTYVLSIPKYAEKLFQTAESDEAKAVVRDALAYIKAAKTYFDESADASLDALLTDYVAGDEATLGLTKDNAVSECDGDALTSTCLNLGATPAFVFYLKEGVSDKVASTFRFTSESGAPLATAIKTAADGRTYLEVTTYAYGMTDTLHFTYTDETGEHTGSYNLAAYYTDSESSEEVKQLVRALAQYAKSAKAYRDSVTKGE